MAKKKQPSKTYRVSSRVLADKGKAEPARRRNRLELVDGGQAEAGDEALMSNAVMEATLDVLAEPPGRPGRRKPAASMGVLYEERLEGVAFWDPDSHRHGPRPLRARRSAPPRLVAPEPGAANASGADSPAKDDLGSGALGRAIRRLWPRTEE